MRFEYPYFLLLLLAIVAAFFWRRLTPQSSHIKFSDSRSFKLLEDRKAVFLSQLSHVLRYVILILMVITLAKPQGVYVEQDQTSEGISIVIALDVSGSMRAEDFEPNNRLVVAKKTIKEFIQKRSSDPIGLVVFGKDAYSQSPLTLDYPILMQLLNEIDIGMSGDGTAIGMAIATGLNRLKEVESKSKIIILLTDGENNSGQIDPMSAAKLAADLNVKVYTIGIGKEGGAPIPLQDPLLGKVYARHSDGSLVMTTLDEKLLTQIASVTHGQYFRATSQTALEDILSTINQLETTKIKTKKYFHYYDYFPILLWIILGLLMVELMITTLIVFRVP